jgi:plastocyanin
MPRRARTIPVLLGVTVLAAAGAHAAFSSHAAVSQTMRAYVHEDTSIGLTFDDGTAVGNQARTPPTIPPGTYTIQAVDDAFTHNFHLSGPDVDVSTTIGGTGSPTWTVTFQPGGQYRFVCDDHPDFMYGVFFTSGGNTGGTSSSGSSSGGSSSSGSSGSGTSGGSTSKGSSLAGALVGRVNPAGKLTLTWGGVRVTKVKAGRYKITVADKTPARGFLVQQKGRAATTVTGVSFVGTRSVTLTLGPGEWTFFTSAGPRSVSAFSVTS